MAVHTAVLAAAEVAEKTANQGISYLVGGIVFVILSGLMLALLAFGRGREHS